MQHTVASVCVATSLFTSAACLQIDWLAHKMTRGQDIPSYQMNAVASVWVLATFLAGGAEGVISTVVFGEAAAVKGDRVSVTAVVRLCHVLLSQHHIQAADPGAA
jgi:hypothetical protein